MANTFKAATLKLLDEPRSIYYAGQVIHGQIEYHVSLNKVDFAALNVNFLGEGNVCWKETESEEYNGVKRNKLVEYKNREEYFNVTLPLLPGQNSLPRGIHNLDFSFQIPNTAPSSFQEKRANITYTITAYIDYADQRFAREQISKEFEVVAPLNLNTEEGRRPIEFDFEEMYSCCCSSTPMSIKIHIPQTGFVPGQAIPILIKAENSSSVEVKKIIFKLVKKVAYRSFRPTSEFVCPEEILQTLKTGAILGNTTREIEYQMVVPDMIAINLDNCEIVDMGYGLKVIVKLSGCNDDLEDESEIILGVVPIPGSPGSENYKHPMAHSLPVAPVPTPPPENAKVPSHQNMGVKVFPNATVGFSTNSYQTSNSTYPTGPTNPTPYPTNPTPYPTNPAPYPTNASPYPSNPSPYPTNPTPYPTNPTPFPANPSPYPTNPSPYPASPYPTMPQPQPAPRHNVSPGYPIAAYPAHNTSMSPSAPPP